MDKDFWDALSQRASNGSAPEKLSKTSYPGRTDERLDLLVLLDRPFRKAKAGMAAQQGFHLQQQHNQITIHQ